MESATATKTATWVLDASHSEILFRVKHLMISTVKGEFRSFSGKIEGKDFTTAPVTITIDADSVFTNDENRDGHLKSADFFDVENLPQITFTSTSFTKMDDDNYILKGNLSLHGVEKPVTLEVEAGGIAKDPWGNTKAGFSVNGKINRKDFGLNWNAALETGGVLVSDEVKIHAEVQFALVEE